MKTATRYIAFALIAFFMLSSSALPQNPKPKITFVELGSTMCIPCKKMQPIMKSVEKKYGSQLKVIFHDVNKEKQAIDDYKIKLIPTQVFLDESGKEIHRHEGFYPEKEIDKFLQSKGLKIRKK